jgi:Zinc-binding dehydrogenase
MQRRQSRVSVVSDTSGGETLERLGSRPPTVVCAVSLTVTLSRQELIKMKQLIDGGLIQPIVSAVFPLEARQAFQRRFGRDTRGKLVLLSVQPG